MTNRDALVVDEVQRERRPFLGLQMDAESTVDDLDGPVTQARLVGVQLLNLPSQGKVDDASLLCSVYCRDEVIEHRQHHALGVRDPQFLLSQLDDRLRHPHLGVSGVG